MPFARCIAAGVAPLGQRVRGVFRLPPLSLWTPLSPQRERGCSPLSDPKGVGSNRKYGRFTPFGVKIFSPYFRLPPIGKAPQSLRDSSPQGSGFRKSTYSRCALAAGQQQQMQLPGTPPPVKKQLWKIRRFSRVANLKIILPLQQRRPLPAAETGRSCWGSGQQDMSAAQGTKWTLGAATRFARAPAEAISNRSPNQRKEPDHP